MSGHDETTRGLPSMVMPTPVIVGAKFDDRYLVRRQVGQGGMGTVYAAQDMMLGELVALKVLRPLVAEEKDVIERFRREVRLARKVAHPNVARTYDIDVAEGLHYLTMELIEGTTLSAVLRDQPRLPVPRAVDIAMQICAGLDAAHRENVVHRDLKPGNVLIERSGRVVITDFGVACMMSGGGLLTGDPNIMVGTPAYMAPEQITSGDIGAHTDIYSLGLVLYQMLTGQIPFREESQLDTAFARLKREPEDPGSLAELPPELSALVLRCLARDPAKRPASARELADLLAPFLHDPSDATLSDGSPRDTLVPTHLGISASFASIRMGTHSLAVLPMRYRGPASEAYIAEAITEELVDILSMTRGLKVLSTAASARFGAVDGVINNAGIIQPFVRLKDLNFDAIERVSNVNLYGTLYMVKAFLPNLINRPVAHIANTSSMGGFLPVPGQTVYGASKAAVKLLTEGLYAELLNTNVKVTVIFPGAVGTNIAANSGVSISAPTDRKSSIKPLPAVKAAQIIVDAIERDRYSVFVGSDAKFMDFIYRLSPKRAAGFIYKQMKSLLPG